MITDYLINKSGGLLQIQEEPNDWTGKQYKCFNTGGVECEVGEFLYGLVRMIKPEIILETGTHKGVSSSYMAQALKDNDLPSKLITVEHFKELFDESNKLFKNLELTQYIKSVHGKVEDIEMDFKCDLIFLDTEPEYRFQELVRFYPYLKEGGYLFIHDLPRGFCEGNINPDHPDIKNWPFGEVPEEMKRLLKNGDLAKFHFGTPRSLTGFYKKMTADYEVK